MADIINGDFEDGLSGWHIVSGTAFTDQPRLAAEINASEVVIDGGPPVSLGGNFWHTGGYPLGHHQRSLIRIATDASGVLDSDPFTITQRYLVYRLGGSSGGGSALEVRIPAATATARHRRAIDMPDADGYVAIVVATPDGSDILAEQTIDLVGPLPGDSLMGETAKVRLRVSVVGGLQRLVVDHIRLVDEQPPKFRRPLWGWADIHCHPMAQAGFGDLLAGHIHGPVEDVGSCLEVHGHEHGNPLHLLGLVLDGGHHNDGSLATSGWSTTATPGPEDQGFRGWPAFDEITHLKTHQDWIRRAYDGGLRLMVALIVHNEVLAAVSTALKLEGGQSDRDVVEPQVQVLREFVAHNGDWCGWAKTPDEARNLIEDNKLAFVLGLETDSINGWSKFTDLPNEKDDNATRTAVHERIHCYFKYLRGLGVVQINLIHLSDNTFGGMALYDVKFVFNNLLRTGRLPDVEDGYLDPNSHLPRGQGEAISLPVTVASKVREELESLVNQLGVAVPDFDPKVLQPYGHGHRNTIGLMPAGKEALREAMRFGMVIDMDHMSEKATAQAHDIATDPKQVPEGPYPLVAAHNGARMLAMTPPAKDPTKHMVPGPNERRNPETWPNESTKSETQLGYIKNTRGMFGHGVAGTDSQPHGSVPNDAPGTSKTFAQGLQYVMHKLGVNDDTPVPVGLGTDLNVLIGGPGPRFGPMAIHGLAGELKPKNDDPDSEDDWTKAVRKERWTDAAQQTDAVSYNSKLRDWRSYRFRDSGLYDPDRRDSQAGIVGFIWQALALQAIAEAEPPGVDLTSKAVVDALKEPALDLALGLTDGAAVELSVYFQAGAKSRNPGYAIQGTPDDVARVMKLVDDISAIRVLWERLTKPGAAPALSRATAGPLRDFDYNLDGLAHYGMLPDMLQDLTNVGLPPNILTQFFASAERYIQVWERGVAVAATIPHPQVDCPGEAD
jgi:hypothetical protein